MSYKRIQKKGVSFGKNTKTRKTSINLDMDVANVIEEKRKTMMREYKQDFPFGKIINDGLRSHFGLVI